MSVYLLYTQPISTFYPHGFHVLGLSVRLEKKRALEVEKEKKEEEEKSTTTSHHDNKTTTREKKKGQHQDNNKRRKKEIKRFIEMDQ
jgi:hypothetical protein